MTSEVRFLGWAPLECIRRRIISMAAGDDGTIQWQMECGHICWLTPLHAENALECEQLLRDFEAGQQMSDGCMQCTDGLMNSIYPLGIKLPVPKPVGLAKDWSKRCKKNPKSE